LKEHNLIITTQFQARLLNLSNDSVDNYLSGSGVGLERKENLSLNYNEAVKILNIIHRLAFYLKHNVSETGFCFCLQVLPAQMGSRQSYSTVSELAETGIGPETGINSSIGTN
jgi:hypothetical protein